MLIIAALAWCFAYAIAAHISPLFCIPECTLLPIDEEQICSLVEKDLILRQKAPRHVFQNHQQLDDSTPFSVVDADVDLFSWC